MKPVKKRIWVFAALFFAIVALTALLLHLNRRPEPVVTVFLTKLYTVEDPAVVSELYEKVELEIQRKMEPGGAQGVVALKEGEDALYLHYSMRYGSLCTKEGFEKMVANRFFAACEQAATRQNWKLQGGIPILDQHTENQFGYSIDVTVTNLETGERKTVAQQGTILVKKTLLGYKIEAIQMQSTDLVDPQPELF